MLNFYKKDKVVMQSFSQGYANKVLLKYITKELILIHFVYEGKREYVEEQHKLKNMIKAYKSVKYIPSKKIWVVFKNNEVTVRKMIEQLVSKEVTVFVKKGSRIHKHCKNNKKEKEC